MEYLSLSFVVIIALLFCFLLIIPSKSESSPRKTKPRIVFEYDKEGYNRQGYNKAGRNRQGKYNRLYNVKCCQSELYNEEDFIDIRKNPHYLTNHA